MGVKYPEGKILFVQLCGVVKFVGQHFRGIQLLVDKYFFSQGYYFWGLKALKGYYLLFGQTLFWSKISLGKKILKKVEKDD